MQLAQFITSVLDQHTLFLVLVYTMHTTQYQKLYYRHNIHIVSLKTDGAPPDGTPISTINTYHIAVVVVFDALALCGVVLTIAIAIFNFVYRKNRYRFYDNIIMAIAIVIKMFNLVLYIMSFVFICRIIRLTTPVLNNVILSGAFLIYIAVIFCVLPCTTKDIFLWTQCIVSAAI